MRICPSLAPAIAVLATYLLISRASGTEAPAPVVDSPLYVTIDTLEPMEFHHFRLGRADGRELILSTLRMNADKQARFAGYPGDVVVLDEETAPPEGARALRLTWTEDVVTAELFPGHGAKPVYLGVVSRDPLSHHPDYKRMRREIEGR